MPLNKAALPLDAAPSAVGEARRWVGRIIRDLRRDDLVECAELGVSELVTNAILHGEAPLDVRVRGTAAHPRIEVYDSSHRPPILPTPDRVEGNGPEDALLNTYGRGLAMVAMASEAWGASLENGGKIVWFEPSKHVHEKFAAGVVDGQDDIDSDWEPLPDSFTVRLVGVDLSLLHSVLEHYGNLRRELRLLALAHDTDYPLARDLSQMFATFDRQFPPSMLVNVARAFRTATGRMDLVFDASPQSIPVFRTVLDMFELADQFCESQHLLSLARTPAQRRLHEWLLDEFIRQCDGHAPVRWNDDSAPHARAV